MRILVTGFGPFGQFAINPSAGVVQEVAKRGEDLGMSGLAAEVLPTEFRAGGERIRHLIREMRPEACVCLGVCDGDGTIRLERVAMNRDDSGVLDAAGQPGSGGRIVPDGPDNYFSTLPVARFQTVLEERGIPVSISDYAGGYVCNHVFYLALHEIVSSGLETRCGFIHVPSICGITEPMSSIQGLPFPMLIEAVESCLAVLQESVIVS